MAVGIRPYMFYSRRTIPIKPRAKGRTAVLAPSRVKIWLETAKVGRKSSPYSSLVSPQIKIWITG